MKKPKSYAFMADDKIRLKSSSGGVFPVLGEYFYKNDGYVCGAIFNEDMTVSHIVSNKIEDIEKMCGSKYVQSSMGTCYKQIKELLENKKKVLFTGTPCQVAGLRAFLKKDYNDLYCVDLICFGTCAQKVFKKYLQENFSNINIESVKFRDKSYQGWKQALPNIMVNNEFAKNNDYLKLFFNRISLREACYCCKNKGFPRQGDLTMGDLCGKKDKKLDDKMGTSLLFVNNNNKAKFLFKILKNNSKLLEKVCTKKAISANPYLMKSVSKPLNYDLFWKNYDKMTLSENKAIVLEDKCDCMIENFWYAVNYGALLTCYGVQCLVEKLGLSAKIINFIPYNRYNQYVGTFAQEFAKKYLNLTKKCENYEDLVKLSENCKCFITGSDQVFSRGLMNSHYEGATNNMYLLDFPDSSSKKLSYAGSFGCENLEKVSCEDIKVYQHYLSQFDEISVREDVNVELVKKYFNLDSVQLIDGAFHIPKQTLDEMTEKYVYDTKYIVYFSLPYEKMPKIHKNLLDKISKKLNIPVKKVTFSNNMPVEQWLSIIKNASFVISDSYHAVVFSIIFNVPFVQVINRPTMQSRMESLYRILELPNNSIPKYCAEYDIEKILEKPDWQRVNAKINQEIEKAQKWLKAAFEKPTKDKSQYEIMNYLIAKSFIDSENNRLLANKNKILFNYYKYKMFYNFGFGKKKKRYENRYYTYKRFKKRLKNMYKPLAMDVFR